MKFIKKDFMLQNSTAKKLYHDYAADMPIIDYHCHINPKEIFEDRKFENITQVWLGGDHYKWRVIRSCGVPEEEITGSASDRVKFQHFAEAMPRLIGNPMYHWTHLELKNYFGYDGVLNGETAEEVWNLCNEKLKEDSFSVRNLIMRSNVEMIGTTDDPIDSLEWHEKLKWDSTFTVKVLPSFRPDKAVNIDKEGFTDYISALGKAAGIEISSVEDVKKALSLRLDHFCSLGCRASDHGLDKVVFAEASEKEIEAIFKKALNGKEISEKEADSYKTAILLHLGKEYAKRDIVMQLHYGARRNTNTPMFKKLGPDTGFDCISGVSCGEEIILFMNALISENALPKTILYSLNPADNEMLDTILGCFQGTEIAGKIQHGSAWWFNDNKIGMEDQIKSLANLSVLGNFIGMLTDSRSFLSYTRHEYFRRILCNVIGGWIEDGEYPDDIETAGALVRDISYNNAVKYFSID